VTGGPRTRGDRREASRRDQAIVLLSGGIDSAVALRWAIEQGWVVRPLTFDYFARPTKERTAIEALSARAGVGSIRHVDLPFLKEVDDLRKEGLPNPRLLEAPESYVPARNLIFYGLAAHFAERDGARYIVGGHNGIDPESFPDSSPKFFDILNRIYRLGLWTYDEAPVQIVVPLSGKSKANVVRLGLLLGRRPALRRLPLVRGATRGLRGDWRAGPRGVRTLGMSDTKG
jgi:7-cyano-7-deazaguanine synthase